MSLLIKVPGGDGSSAFDFFLTPTHCEGKMLRSEELILAPIVSAIPDEEEEINDKVTESMPDDMTDV